MGCCVKQCRKSFHYSCSLKNNCVWEFVGVFKSYCHVHYNTNTLNTTLTHTPDTPCNICDEPMGEFNAVSSLQMMCCSTDQWFHKLCLKKQAVQMEDDFKCPNCANSEVFRENMMMNGVFIPKSSAIALYNSFDETEPGPSQKKRRVHKSWIYERTFSNKKAADEFLQQENWGYHY